MIKNWQYNGIGDRRDFVKNYIKENNLKSVDVGASFGYWSYPECKYVVDSVEISSEGTTFFKVDLEDKSTWSELLDYVDQYGKFDFSICSHTLEDIFNPLDVISLLEKISNSGFVAIPSKYDEFVHLYDHKYRGNAHHKQFFDFVGDELIIFPKFSFIETDSRSDEVISNPKGRELSLFWENEIPVNIFGKGVPFRSDDELINKFYNQLL
jgi:hypothetical protein